MWCMPHLALYSCGECREEDERKFLNQGVKVMDKTKSPVKYVFNVQIDTGILILLLLAAFTYVEVIHRLSYHVLHSPLSQTF